MYREGSVPDFDPHRVGLAGLCDSVALLLEATQVSGVAGGFGGLEAQIPAPVTVLVGEDALGGGIICGVVAAKVDLELGELMGGVVDALDCGVRTDQVRRPSSGQLRGMGRHL